MNHQIAFSDEQAMLLETAADFCRKHSPIETVRASLNADQLMPKPGRGFEGTGLAWYQCGGRIWWFGLGVIVRGARCREHGQIPDG